jgi:pyrimidine operon attenuation protein/uracil phosphoribosyltransferase
VHADYIGRVVDTQRDERVEVKLREMGAQSDNVICVRERG